MKFSASNSIMANLRLTPAWQRARTFLHRRNFLRSQSSFGLSPSLLYHPCGTALLTCRRGIKRCVLCTVRHITGLTPRGKNLSIVVKEILTHVKQKKRACHVCNITENIFSAFHKISPIGSEGV